MKRDDKKADEDGSGNDVPPSRAQDRAATSAAAAAATAAAAAAAADGIEALPKAQLAQEAQ
jgi:hypothetical protein